MSQVWTVKSVLDWTTDDFTARGIESPRLEAEILLSRMLEEERLYLYTHFDRPLHPDELQRFRAWVARRRNGECTAYIVGEKEFWSLSFEVTPDVLVPRPDTETLVQAAVDVLRSRGESPSQVLDLCTGSGCVAVALASECNTAEIHATDISAAALTVARRNVSRHRFDDRVTLFEGDLFNAVPKDNRYDVIVSNPPYVIGHEIAGLSAEVQREPRLALVGGGDDGLDICRRLLADAKLYIKPGGYLFIELDNVQTVQAANELGPTLLGTAGWVIDDLAGKHRVAAFQL
ncbi:MAG: peptide chain release factor N(5)-glutamine methyltransferase [Deltaproteobacteria bacterium]|nr:peptide chain release factor N(5)-glutamine methyltransferase [Deltaproteobacteria bacterium]MBN2673956.1 peptide chain release factor N(5)-glutamine methyltransferase [Deltaproteobacteria bacterium]